MAQSKTRHAGNVTGSDNSYGEVQLKDYQKQHLDATQMAALWIARRFHLPMPAARLIAALASFGGCA